MTTLAVPLLILLVTQLCGCLFDGGDARVVNAPARAAYLCPPAAVAGGCPACSTPDGGRCRDQWYSSGLRCASDAQCAASGACRDGFCVGVDVDGDDLDDALEKEVAELNFPKLLLADGEECGTPHGVVYRVRRHPDDPRRLAVTYVVLYAADCGELNGHTGDAETFAITVDLDAEPGASATVSVAAWAHAGTICGSTSSCTTEAATAACGEPAARSSPPEIVIYASRNKHAEYLSTDTCADNCFDECSAHGTRIFGPLLNVGEPGHPLVSDLTTQGFVQAADGWPAELLDFDPWGTAEFAGGGRIDTPLDRVAPAGP